MSTSLVGGPPRNSYLVPDEKAVVMIESCANEIFRATTIPEVVKAITQAEAISAVVRALEASERVRKDGACLVIRAERRLGEISLKIPHVPRGVVPRDPVTSQPLRPPTAGKIATLQAHGIHHQRYRRAEALAKPSSKVFERALAACETPSVQAVLNQMGAGRDRTNVRAGHVRVAEEAVDLLDRCCKARRPPRRDEVNRLQLMLASLNIETSAS